jgi:[2Fe-2S] binding domain
VTAMSKAAGHIITTIEGLGTIDNPHPIQAAFVTEQAMHCGFCISGPMLYGKGIHRQESECIGGRYRPVAHGTALPLLCAYSHDQSVGALRTGERMSTPALKMTDASRRGFNNQNSAAAYVTGSVAGKAGGTGTVASQKVLTI